MLKIFIMQSEIFFIILNIVLLLVKKITKLDLKDKIRVKKEIK